MERVGKPIKAIVHVWQKPYEIYVYRKSKTVWVAVGEYMGERIEVNTLSERSAENRWQGAARYRSKSGPAPPPAKPN